MLKKFQRKENLEGKTVVILKKSGNICHTHTPFPPHSFLDQKLKVILPIEEQNISEHSLTVHSFIHVTDKYYGPAGRQGQ